MTAGNLRSAFGGESMAHMRYRTWGAKAERDGFPNVARLFRAISSAEEIHANNHFRVLRREQGAFLVAAGAGFGLGSTSENLAGAIEGETFEVQEMYPTYLEAARLQKEKTAQRSFHFALEAEKTHAAMYGKAKRAVEKGRDVSLGPVQVCRVCGWTVEGKAPATCPICQTARRNFDAYE